MNQIKEFLAKHFKAARKKLANYCLDFGMKHSPEYLHAKAEVVAQKAATAYIEKEMRSQGMLKCAITTCLKRSPLRKIDNGYVCESHFAILKANIRKQQENKIPQAGVSK